MNYEPSRSDMALRKALHAFRRARTVALFDAAILRSYGPGIIMPNAILERIVDAAHVHQIMDVDDLIEVTHWDRAADRGADIIEIINTHVPLPPATPSEPLQAGYAIEAVAPNAADSTERPRQHQQKPQNLMKPGGGHLARAGIYCHISCPHPRRPRPQYRYVSYNAMYGYIRWVPVLNIRCVREPVQGYTSQGAEAGPCDEFLVVTGVLIQPALHVLSLVTVPLCCGFAVPLRRSIALPLVRVASFVLTLVVGLGCQRVFVVLVGHIGICYHCCALSNAWAHVRAYTRRSVSARRSSVLRKMCASVRRRSAARCERVLKR
ncbi:hypothetical protein FA95DRAFT_1354181 [Auriscalpium vulgare]|uniref:Uncharacterized protein n=1 Tax=Auriscalpium vulgare TaxID=40419 RepID=A0ACB8R277_9AGAM|nr:hypothetical protein FA95DRAFT_1354181 [Auriscalpium vulgare]